MSRFTEDEIASVFVGVIEESMRFDCSTLKICRKRNENTTDDNSVFKWLNEKVSNREKELVSTLVEESVIDGNCGCSKCPNLRGSSNATISDIKLMMDQFKSGIDGIRGERLDTRNDIKLDIDGIRQEQQQTSNDIKLMIAQSKSEIDGIRREQHETSNEIKLMMDQLKSEMSAEIRRELRENRKSRKPSLKQNQTRRGKQTLIIKEIHRAVKLLQSEAHKEERSVNVNTTKTQDNLV